MDTASKKRLAFIARKSKTLETQLTSLDDAINDGKYNRINLKLRLDRLTTLFNDYEILHEELTEIDDANELVAKITGIQDSYYDIASRVQGMSNLDESIQPTMGETTFLEKQRNLKLPVAELPKFDGSSDKWLSFRNSFLTMIDSRTDVDDLVKFFYLKNTLLGEALNKITIYDASAANYKRAWNLLVESYEQKRALVANHLDAILDMQPLTKATKAGLSKIIDDSRQHLGMLETLHVRPDERMVVRILERVLPIGIRNKWEEKLALDELPSLEQFYKFINQTAFRLGTLEQDDARRGEKGSKRHADSQPSTAKARRVGSTTRALVLNASNSCVKCRGDHFLYKCPAFEKFNTHQRWDFVRQSKLCRNCLRAYDGTCNRTHCKFCPKYHHSLLHSQQRSPTAGKQEKPATVVDSKPARLDALGEGSPLK